MQNASFQTTNPNSDNFSQFENARLMDRLEKKFTPKPYWKNYALLRGVVLCSSYLFNVLSAATAAALVFFTLRALLGSDIVAGAITAAALIALELVKRETGQRFFHDLLQFRKMSFGLAGVVVLMMGLSTTASYFGAKRAVTEFTPPPVTVRADSLTAPLLAQVTAADQQIKAAAQMKKKGVVTASAQRTIERLSKQKETALGEVARIQARTDTRNDNAETKHELSTKINANGFAAITLVSEILLLLCLWYLQFYDYRSFVEFCEKGSEAGQVSPEEEARLAANVVAAARLGGTNLAPPINNGHQVGSSNGVPITNEVRRPIGFAYGNRDTETVHSNQRHCKHCKKSYVYGHARQVYCGDLCRVAAWEIRTGQKLKKQRAATG